MIHQRSRKVAAAMAGQPVELTTSEIPKRAATKGRLGSFYALGCHFNCSMFLYGMGVNDEKTCNVQRYGTAHRDVAAWL
jgi:hypothetical protein